MPSSFITANITIIIIIIVIGILHDEHHSQYDHHLGSVVHDLIGELRLGDVLPELLDPRASRLGWAVLVDHLFGEDHGDDDDYDLDDCHSKFTLSHSLLAASPSGRMPQSSLITCKWFTKIHSMYFLLNFFSFLGEVTVNYPTKQHFLDLLKVDELI